MRQTVNLSEGESLRHALRRATWIGLWVWPSFTLLDAYMCFVAFPGAPFPLFVVGRVVVEAALLGVYWSGRQPAVPVGFLARCQNASFVLAAMCIALMAIPLGALRSPYMHGISIVLLVRAVVMPEPRHRALPVFTAIGLTFPAVMLAQVLVSLQARSAALEGNTLVVFGANFVFVIASAAVGLMSGHSSWAARQQLFRARRLGRYRLQAPIGRGGMGEVWLAWDQALRRNVALKLLRPAGVPDPDALRRFEREAQAASQMRIPHSVQIYDFGVSDDGIHYIAMEYLIGVDLETLVTRNGPLPPGRAIHFARQVCDCLEEAHTAGIIHRDVKPSNLFVTRVGGNPDFLKLLDFGVARLRQSPAGDVRLTKTGTLCGTPAYLAPEIWEGKEADERSDIYAVGGDPLLPPQRPGAVRGDDPGGSHDGAARTRPLAAVGTTWRVAAARPGRRGAVRHGEAPARSVRVRGRASARTRCRPRHLECCRRGVVPASAGMGDGHPQWRRLRSHPYGSITRVMSPARYEPCALT
jgi:eukaryotic-like serine/threonine-protein kinase